MTLQSALLVVAAYLVGSIPTSYLAAKWLKGIDLRRYGSGTVSGSGLWEHVNRWVIVPVGLFDVCKALVPTWLGIYLGLGMPVAVTAGMAATLGHNWPVFLHFTGGRGLGCYLGILVVIFPWGAAWLLGFLAIGWLLGDSAPWALASLALLPVFARLLGGPAIILPLAIAMLVLALAKRLEANRRPLPPPGRERWTVIFRRLVLDRDIASHREWLDRKPGD